MIVILNGTSSAGTTSLARVLQRTWDGPLPLVGIDTVVFALPGRWLNAPGWHEVFVHTGSDSAGDLPHTLDRGDTTRTSSSVAGGLA